MSIIDHLACEEGCIRAGCGGNRRKEIVDTPKLQ